MKNQADGYSINLFGVQGFYFNPEHHFNLSGIFL
jgi:hypothetical protein